MRVISQNGTMDFPYEISTIFIYPRIENAIAIQSAGDSEISIIGRYSSKEKAIKAMEMLRKVYENNVFYHCTASSKRFEEVQSILSKEQFQKATTEYFQFPQDDEIEV
jgi:hypothetical protein